MTYEPVLSLFFKICSSLTGNPGPQKKQPRKTVATRFSLQAVKLEICCTKFLIVAKVQQHAGLRLFYHTWH